MARNMTPPSVLSDNTIKTLLKLREITTNETKVAYSGKTDPVTQ